MSLESKVRKQLESEKLKCSQANGTYMCQIVIDNETKHTFNLGSRDLRLALKILWEDSYNDKLSDKEVAEIISILEIECFKSVPIETQYHRVYVQDKKALI